MRKRVGFSIGIGVNIEDATLPDHLEFVLEQLGIREKVGKFYQIKRLYKTVNGEQVEDTAAEAALTTYYNQIKKLIDDDSVGEGKTDYSADTTTLQANLDKVMTAIQADTALTSYKSIFPADKSISYIRLPFRNIVFHFDFFSSVCIIIANVPPLFNTLYI